MDDFVLIKTGPGKKWNLLKKEDTFYFQSKKGDFAKTPGGKLLRTTYPDLANRILSDLTTYGENNFSAESIIPWHDTMVENVVEMPHRAVEEILKNCFLDSDDWTYGLQTQGTRWAGYFGNESERPQQIREWFKKATLMQLTAICCIGNAYRSVNLAFVLAVIMENFTGNTREEMLVDLFSFVSNKSPYYISIESFMNFELYYGIHLKDNGPIINFSVSDSKSCEPSIDVESLTDHQVTVEQLIGRNFYHYTNGKKDSDQLASCFLGDLSLSTDSEYPTESQESDEAEDSKKGDDLSDFLPDDCWVKRFVDDSNPCLFYLLYLEIDADGKITDSGCLEETMQSMGYMIVGKESPATKYYDSISSPPDKVTNDLVLLFRGRVLPLEFSFIGKRLPQQMIDTCENDIDPDEEDFSYDITFQSAHRLAYISANIFATTDHIIEDFDYSTYQSSGSDWGDMVSRPVWYSDSQEEAVDMLLYILDRYSDEEYSSLVGSPETP